MKKTTVTNFEWYSASFCKSILEDFIGDKNLDELLKEAYNNPERETKIRNLIKKILTNPGI